VRFLKRRCGKTKKRHSRPIVGNPDIMARFLVLASFWIYLFGPDRAPWTEAMHEFYGMRHTAEIHTPWVMLGSLLIILNSFTLFLRRRRLFGRVARFWTITIAILFIVLAAATGLAALVTYAGSFLCYCQELFRRWQRYEKAKRLDPAVAERPCRRRPYKQVQNGAKQTDSFPLFSCV